jgi:hypothetical protein
MALRRQVVADEGEAQAVLAEVDLERRALEELGSLPERLTGRAT